MSNFLLQRNKTFYYRRRIPKELLKYFKNREEIRIKVSQSSHFQATMSIKVLNSLFKELITMLDLDALNEKDALIIQYITRMKEFAETNTPTPPIITYSMQQFCQEQNEEINDQILDKLETYTLQEKKKLLKNLNALETFTQIIDVRSDFTPKVKEEPIRLQSTTITFKELYDLFIKEKKLTAPNTTQSTWRDYEAAYQDFIYVIENAETRDIISFVKEDLRIFADALHNHIPASRTKKPQFKDLTYSELKGIELNENERTAFATKQKKMLSIKQMFDIALDARYGYISENIIEPFLMKKPKNTNIARIDRKPLSQENLKKLFNSKLYTEKLEHTLTFAPEKFWIPIIAGCSGMRQNEICQLYIEDVTNMTTDKGETIWYFDLNEEKDKHLKNANAVRLVPLHPKLIELGFIEYYTSIKDKQERLWNNLRLHPKEQRYNTDYGKSFMKYFRQYITQEEDQVFHSLRHNVGDQLIKNTVREKLPKMLVNVLMGHEPDEDMTSKVYSHGFGVEELYEGIKTLWFDGIF